MGNSSDSFWGEYVAPAALLTGAGITGYRTFQQVSAGRISAPWRQQKEQKDLLQKLKSARANRYEISATDLADALDFDTSRYKGFNIFTKNRSKIEPAFKTAKELTVKSLLRSFNLSSYAQTELKVNLENLGDISAANLRHLIGLSPSHKQHVERVARSTGLLHLVDIPGADTATGQSLEKRAKLAYKQLITGHEGLIDRTAPDLGAFMEEHNISSEIQKHRRIKQIQMDSPEVIAAYFEEYGFGKREDLIAKTHRLFQAAKGKGLKTQLILLKEGARTELSQVRISSGKAFQDIPIQQANGRIRLGALSPTEYVARQALNPGEMRSYLAGNKGTKISMGADEFLMDYFTENMDDLVEGDKYKRFVRSHIQVGREDMGRLLIPTVANEGLNVKRVYEMAAKGFGASADELSSLRKMLAERNNYDPVAGLGPNQVTNDVFTLPHPSGRIAGSLPVGYSADSRTTAQRSRPFKILNEGRGASTKFVGMLEEQSGDQMLRMRTAAIPEEHLNALLAGSSRPELRANDDILFLLDRNIRYGESRTIRLGKSNLQSAKLEELLQNETLRRHAFGEGIQARISFLEGLGGDTITAEQKAERDLLEQARRISPSEILGESSKGGFQKGPKSGNFLLDKILEDPKTGELALAGMDERTLGDTEKLFGNKKVIQMVPARTEFRGLATIYEMAKGSSDILPIMALPEGPERAAALKDFYGKYMDAFRRSYGKAIKSNNGFTYRIDPNTGSTHHITVEEIIRGTPEFRDFELGPPTEPEVLRRAPIEEALRRTRGVQAVESQGIKKIGEKSLDTITTAMLAELSERHQGIVREADTAAAHLAGSSGLGGDYSDWQRAYSEGGAEKARFGHALRSGIKGEELAAARAGMKRAKWLSSETARLDPSVQGSQFTIGQYQKERRDIEGFFAEVGITPGKDNIYRYQDALTTLRDPRSTQNVTNLFDKALGLTRDIGMRNKLSLWSTSQLFADIASQLEGFKEKGDLSTKGLAIRELLWKDQQVTAEMLDQAIQQFQTLGSRSRKNADIAFDQMVKGEMKVGPMANLDPKQIRELIIRGVEPQLQHQVYNLPVAIGGRSTLTSASGGMGSMSLANVGHMREQGGVMAELADELLGRQTGTKLEQAQEIAKRFTAFQGTIPEGIQAIPLAEFANNSGVGNDYIEGLFSPTQPERNAAFDKIGAQYGLDKPQSLYFDIGGGKYIYHPRATSPQTGSFITSEGQAIRSDLDKSFADIIKGHQVNSPSLIESGKKAYGEAIVESTIGRDKPLIKAYSGKVLGSMRGQARPQLSEEFFTYLKDKGLTHRVGIREATFQSMSAQAGMVDQYKEGLGSLRRGEYGMVLSRDPQTELYRTMAAQGYSLDEAVGEFTDKRLSGMSLEEKQLELVGVTGEEKYNKFRENYLEKSRKAQEAVALARKKLADSHPNADQRPFERRVEKAERRLEKLGSWEGAISEKIKKSRLAAFGKEGVYLPEHVLKGLGADFDDDQVNLFLAKDKNARQRLSERAGHQNDLVASWMDQTNKGMADTDIVAQVRAGRTDEMMRPEQLLAEEDFLYKAKHKALYSQLYDRPGGIISAEALMPGTPEWKQRVIGEMTMAQLEKGEIGSMSNAVDFVRTSLRAKTSSDKASGKLFTEMLLGIMPELPLKGKQYGAQGIEEAKIHILNLRNILSGRAPISTSPQALSESFQASFKSIMGSHPVVEDMMKFVPDVIAEVKAGSRGENVFTRMLKSRQAAEVNLDHLMKLAMDPTVPSPQGELIREAAGQAPSKTGEAGRHIKNARESFSDVYNIMKKNKGPLLIGAAAAVGVSMLLGSPGHISEEEANAAGARHQTSGDPSIPPIESGNFARVSPSSGGSIRIRGTADSSVSQQSVLSMLQSKYPGADVSYNINDYSSSINEEYLRRRVG